MKQDNLVLLIKALTAREKKNFKLFASRRGDSGGKGYVRLFDAISRQRIPIGPSGTEHKSRDPARLSKKKHHLFRLVLRSLHFYDEEAEAGISEHLHICRLLSRKGLHAQAFKILGKVKKEVIRLERPELLPGIIEMERTLGANLFFKEDFFALVRGLMKENDRALEWISDLTRHRLLWSIIVAHGSLEGYARTDEELEKLKKSLAPYIVPPRGTVKTGMPGSDRLHHYITYAAYYALAGEHEKSCEFHGLAVAAMESRPGHTAEEFNRYTAALNNLLVSRQNLKKYKEAEATLEKLKTVIRAKQGEGRSAIAGNLYAAETNQHIITGEFRKGASLIPAICTAMERDPGIKKNVEVAIHLNVAILYFGNGQYEEALKWLNRILNEEQAYLGEDIYALVKVMNLILHFELGHTDLLEYLVKSTYLFLYKRKRLYKTEDAILAFIRNRLPYITGEKMLLEGFRSLKKDLEKIVRNPYEARAMDHFDFLAWLEAKISKKPYAEMIRKKAAGER